MDFRHPIVTCLFSMLRLSFETQKVKENYAILMFKLSVFYSLIHKIFCKSGFVRWTPLPKRFLSKRVPTTA